MGVKRPDGEQDDRPLSLGAFLPYRLSVASELVSQVFSRSYEERFGLTIPEWRVMAVLGERSPQTTQDVITRTAMDRVRVSRAVIRLHGKGLIERRPQADDQRAQQLSLSEQGRATYRDIVPLARSLQARMMETLTEEEAAMLDRLLTKLHSNAAATLAPER